MVARPLISWDIFHFSETAEQNFPKPDRKQELIVLYPVCVFGPIGKTRWPPDLWLAESFSTSSLKPLNGICRNLTGSKNWTSFTKFLFCRSVGKRWPPLRLISWDIFISSLKPLNGICRNFTGRKKPTSSTMLVLFGPIGKTIWPPRPLIGCDIFDFSETAERSSTKLDNVLYQMRPLSCYSD